MILGIVLIVGTFAGFTVDAVLTAGPAAAAQANSCIDPASGGTAQTWHEGVTGSSYTVECEEETGISGTSAYPTITINTDTVPADGGPTLNSGAACTTGTSGSGATEEYIEECAFKDSPTATDAGTYAATFTSTPSAFAGSTLTASNSGNLNITIAAPTTTCIDPASGGTAATWHEGVTSTYLVECEEQSGESGVTAYPGAPTVNTDTLPVDANPTLSGCTTATSGSGATEQYIAECTFSGTPSASDTGVYAATFTSTGDGGVGSATSGNLNITVNAPTVTCIDPAAGGSTATFNSSSGGTTNAYTVECEEQSGISAVPAYPTSIAVDPTSSLPADASFSASYTGSGTLPSTCVHATSGSGATEFYILECDLNETAISADNGPYTGVFDAVGAGGVGTVTSGTLALTVTGPSDVCTAPAAGGTATTFKAGIANTFSVSCYGTGFASASPGNYPTSITLNTGTLPADATEATSISSSPACTQSTSGSGNAEEYILTCPVTETPTASDVGPYPVTFTETPGANGGSTVTTGTWNLTVAGINPTCIDPATAGSASTFYEGTSNSYTVECEAQSGVSGTAAYPSQIQIATGALPGDSGQTFATSTASSPACTHGTSGSGATEEYILECALSASPTSADAGPYPFTFTATGPGGAGTVTSGTLTVTVTPPSTTCTAPAAGGTATTFTDGTAGSFSVACYSTGFGSAGAGNYPASITLNTGTLPSDVSEATTTTSSSACTQSTSGSGVTEEYILTCPVKETPTFADNGTYPVTFLATGGTSGAPNLVSGTWTLKDAQPLPSWQTDGTTDGNYESAIKGVPFCDSISVTTSTAGGASTGSPASLPLTSLTAGVTPANVTNYAIQNVNLTAGTAQLCGTDNATAATAPVTMAPVATNSAGSATDTIPLWSQNECTWTTTGTTTSDSMFDANQDLEQAGSQSAFGAPITNGEALGSSLNYPTCTGGVGVSGAGGLGTAWTINTANPLPEPSDTNPSAAQGDLPSSNLDLTGASGGAKGGCWGGVNILASTSTTSFGSGSTADMTLPSSWVNGGDCSYGGLGSNSAGGNTDTAAGTGLALCPPTQADVNAGYVSCSITVSSGNDENGSINYSTMDLFFNGQPVPQSPTATLSETGAQANDTINVTGGTNWWGSSGGAPNGGPHGDRQTGDFYAVSAPSVLIGTSRDTAVPVVNSTVTIPANTYVCTGAESTTVGPNPCTLTVGQPTGSFQLPAGLAQGLYNVYIDESNTTPLPGNGPNDSYQTALGTNLGTAESTTQLVLGPPVFTSTTSTNFSENGPNSFAVTALGATPVTYTETGPLPFGVSLGTDGTLSGIPAFGTAGSYPITITATDANSNTTTQSFTLTVGASGPVFTSATSATFTENSPGTFPVTANGDTPITYTETGPLPSGVTLGPDGTLSGTPAFGTAGSYPITITATDANSATATQAFTLTVTAVGPAFTSATSTSFSENVPGTFPVTASGDTPITFTETGPLPSGVSLGPDGTLSGTPAFGTAGSYPITITATDANSATATQSFTLTVGGSAPVFTSAASTTFSENDPGTFPVTATGDNPITYTETGALPSGVTLGPDGTLAGTPAFGTAGSYPITITATDANSGTATQSFTLTVNDGTLVFTSAASTTFTENSPGTFAVTATGDNPITFTETGALPSGVTLGPDGSLSGTPAFGTAGSYPITITATDANSATVTQSFTLTVNAVGPAFTSATSTSFTENDPGTFPVTATGDTPITFTETGALPSGVTLGPDGTLSGTPVVGTAGSYPITITATDANSATATQSFTLTVIGAPSTAMLVPATGTYLRGTSTALDASASAPLGISTVKFVVTGGALNKSVIATATLYYFGYYAAWNTTSVPDGTYTLQSVATDRSGNTTYSAGVSVIVDNTAPTTAVLVPSAGSALRGASATLDASASDNIALSSVQYVLTGGALNKSVIATATLYYFGWAATWNTTTVPDGTYTLQSLATDKAGNTKYSAGVSVIVDNTAPTTAVLKPVAGAKLKGSTSLKASASDNISLSSVQFVITGGALNKSVIGTGSLTKGDYALTWNSATVPAGTYTIQSLATDEAGNTTYSAPVSVTVHQ